MEVNIRIATAADVEALVQLAAALRDYLEQTTPSDADFRLAISALLGDANTDFLLATDASGASLGYVQMRYRQSAWVSGLEAELEDVFVVEAARGRGRGVGRQLVAFAVARAIERGCRSVGLNTNERNDGALALYGRLGFTAARARWSGGRQLWLQKVIA